ncbi:recombination regulator RecX [Paraburkholderia bonniea]|nr:recombination regulator RecX [Paraburkholderia bonniea]WJF93064.1 recombination regulator RecX [Paraburkholderia bonniea]
MRKSLAKKSDDCVMRKGPFASSNQREGDGPVRKRRDGDSSKSPSSGLTRSHHRAVDPFDPFESFTAHADDALGVAPDAAPDARSGDGLNNPQGHQPAVAPYPPAAVPHQPTATPEAQNVAAAPPESTYTRSRGASGKNTNTSKSGSASSPPAPGRSLKGRALGYLSCREYSRTELSRKLAPFVDESSCLDTVLDMLERDGLLSNSRFTESLIHRRASRWGSARIVGELKRHAVDQSLIDSTSAQLRETELNRAMEVWRKKYGQLPETSAERGRQIRFLIGRGFSQAIVGKILRGIDDEWDGT